MKNITYQSLNKTFGNTVDLVKTYAIFTLDVQGNITSWNEGAKNIKGWESTDVIGKYFDFLYSETDRQNKIPERNLKLALKNNLYEEEAIRVRKNGDIFLADITISPYYDKNGTHLGFVKVVRDVTERKKAQTKQLDANALLREEIRRRKKIEEDLKHSNDELEAFASAAGHDLQEPLRMIVSYLQLIERRYGEKIDQDGRDFLQFAIDGSTRMKMLISDLVEYSRIDTLGKPLRETDASIVVQRAINDMKIAIKEANAKVTYDKLPIIMSDPVQLSQLFQNLLANAIKFKRNVTPRIHIGVIVEDQEYIFSVSDNGRGIDAKFLNSVFLIFRQLGTRAERQGSGVGLAIAKKIVMRHKGKIWVESRVGKGSIFYFSIPKSILKEDNHEFIR